MNHGEPVALYVHLPWCIRKCPYCDFNSHAISRDALSDDLEQAYLRALLTDLENDYLALAAGRPIATIFFGGGTPSLLSPTFYQQFFHRLRELAPFASDIEVTLEANPGAVDAWRFGGYRQAGINRLSIGVQSFSAQQLHNLGRVHSAEEAAAALQLAREAGFDNINLDLMDGLPGQAPGEAMNDLQQAIDCQPEHVSWYQLTIEPNTSFYSSPPELPLDDELYEISEAGQALLASSGYQRYEVSAYAREGMQCRHNDNYWRFGDYLGVGAGAHGKLTEVTGRVRRYWKFRQPDTYVDALVKTAGSDLVEGDELIVEFIMNALRRSTGFSADAFERATGQDFSCIASKVEHLVSQQLLEVKDNQVMTSPMGARFLNDVVARFMD